MPLPAQPAEVEQNKQKAKRKNTDDERKVSYLTSIASLPSAMACAEFCPHIGGVVVLSAVDCFRLFLHIAQTGRFRLGLRP
jgi:hypothetical protein